VDKRWATLAGLAEQLQLKAEALLMKSKSFPLNFIIMSIIDF